MANATGAATLSSTLDVAGDVDVNSGKFAVTASDGSLAISSNKFTVAGDTGNTVVAGTLDATGAATLSSTLDVAGDVDVNSGKFAVTASDGSLAISSNKFTVAGDTGNTVVAGTLNATGAATLSSTLDVAGDVDVNSGKFAVTASDGSLAISSNKFTVAGDTGNTVVAGTLNVTGATTLSTLDVAGDVDVNSGKFTVDASTGNTVVALDARLDDCDQPKHGLSIHIRQWMSRGADDQHPLCFWCGHVAGRFGNVKAVGGADARIHRLVCPHEHERIRGDEHGLVRGRGVSEGDGCADGRERTRTSSSSAGVWNVAIAWTE